MKMQQNGLAKLVEEIGELGQVCGKMIQYPELQLSITHHPDGTILREKVVEEMGDVLAAIWFAIHKLNLDEELIRVRAGLKLELFKKWDKE